MADEIKQSQQASIKRAAFIAAIGLADSTYLLFHHVAVKYNFQQGPSICDFGGRLNCDQVAKSAYAELFGVPIAAAGLFYYWCFLALLVWGRAGERESADSSGRFADAFLVYAAAGLGAALYFAWISLFVIDYFCLFCSLLYLVNGALFILGLRFAGRSPTIGRVAARGVPELFSIFLLGGPRPAASRAARIGRSAFRVLMIISAGALAVLSSGILVHYYFMPRQQRENSSDAVAIIVDAWRRAPVLEVPLSVTGEPAGRDIVVGLPEAPLTVVEFSDYECPACRRAAMMLMQAVREGKVRLVLKDFPLDPSCNPAASVHEFSCQAAVMARCAALESEEKYLKMHEALFDMHDWSLEGLLELPARVGLDLEKFDSCFAGQETLPKVKADVALGSALGINGTPAIFVDGKRLPPEASLYVTAVIENILQRRAKEAGK